MNDDDNNAQRGKGGFDRRDFVKLCLGALASSSHRSAFAIHKGKVKTYRRSLLVDHNRQPLGASHFVAGENYIFHYPYITTPCFVLNVGESVTAASELETEAGEKYTWRGGVGPESSLVAFSAICAHKMTHPAKSVSFINYRHERVKFADARENEREGSQVIFCCSERSVYDVRQGARVLGGPARQPLAAIKLDYDANTDRLYAVGTYGGEMFDKFFSKFSDRLQLEYQIADVNRLVAEHTEVVPLDEYCENQVLC